MTLRDKFMDLKIYFEILGTYVKLETSSEIGKYSLRVQESRWHTTTSLWIAGVLYSQGMFGTKEYKTQERQEMQEQERIAIAKQRIVKHKNFAKIGVWNIGMGRVWKFYKQTVIYLFILVCKQLARGLQPFAS